MLQIKNQLNDFNSKLSIFNSKFIKCKGLINLNRSVAFLINNTFTFPNFEFKYLTIFSFLDYNVIYFQNSKFFDIILGMSQFFYLRQGNKATFKNISILNLKLYNWQSFTQFMRLFRLKNTLIIENSSFENMPRSQVIIVKVEEEDNIISFNNTKFKNFPFRSELIAGTKKSKYSIENCEFYKVQNYHRKLIRIVFSSKLIIKSSKFVENIEKKRKSF